MERNKYIESLRYVASAGFIALGLSACVPQDDAYYFPAIDVIVYFHGSENDPRTVVHEKEHQKRAREVGRIWWAFRYETDKQFECEEEIAANKAAGTYPFDSHRACDSVTR